VTLTLRPRRHRMHTPCFMLGAPPLECSFLLRLMSCFTTSNTHLIFETCYSTSSPSLDNTSTPGKELTFNTPHYSSCPSISIVTLSCLIRPYHLETHLPTSTTFHAQVVLQSSNIISHTSIIHQNVFYLRRRASQRVHLLPKCLSNPISRRQECHSNAREGWLLSHQGTVIAVVEVRQCGQLNTDVLRQS
jgi:hypothetical protein